MTFTKNDILTLTKVIKTVVRSEIGNEAKEVKTTLSAEIKLSNMRILNSVNKIEDRVKNVEINVSSLQKDTTNIKSGIKKLRKDLKTTINFFDNRDIESKNALNKTRVDVGLSEFNFG